MKNRVISGATLMALFVMFAACGGNGAANDPATNEVAIAPAPTNQAPSNEAPDQPDVPDQPDKPDEPDQPDPPVELDDVPSGEREDHGLIFTIPFERGEGSVVFSRQNEYLRVEVDVRLPYSGGDGQRMRGSSVDLVLSVDGLNGRHLFFYPQPLWLPIDGRVSAYRVEASYSADNAGPPSVVANPSFVGEGDVAYWDRWTAVMWVDLRYVLVPGNSPGSLADAWHAGLIVGNEVASAVLPDGLNRFNPGKTPDRLLQFKFSELPEVEELDEDPKERLKTREEAIHEKMKKINAFYSMRDLAGCFDTAKAWLEENPDDLWAHNLVYAISNVAGSDKIDPDYVKFLREYVEACPGQSSVQIDLWNGLLRTDQYRSAKEHAERVFASDMCTGRVLTEAHMRLEWAKSCTSWSHLEEAEAQRKLIEEHPEMLKDDQFRVQFKTQAADLALRRGDSAKAVEIYDDVFKDEYKHLGSDLTQQIQKLLTLQRATKQHWEAEQKLREADKAKTNPKLIVETNKGRIVVELFEDDAPNTTASLVSLAQKSFWDGLNFHRVEPNFVIQGGCPNGDGSGGPGYRTRFETNKRRHFRGSFAMARSQSIHSQGSQFYICVSNSPSVVTLSDNQYLVVGRVLEGMDVADNIRAGDNIISIKVENLREHEYTPETLPE